MRKLLLSVMASLLSCTVAHAFWPEAMDSKLEIGVGYRQDSLKWKSDIHSGYYSSSDYDYYDTFGPTFHSDFDWKNINIWTIELRGKYVTCDNVYLRGSADYGWVTSGKVHHHNSLELNNYAYDYGFDHSSHKVKGSVYDVKFALGYQFQLCDNTFSISPLVGYSWHGQHFKGHHHGYGHSSSSDYYSSSSYSYYDYSYSSSGGNGRGLHTRWNGPFIGFDFDYNLCCQWNIFGGYEFHWAHYHAKAKHDRFFQYGYSHNRFQQHAKNAYGSVFDIGISWDMCDSWTVALRGEFQWWCADHAHNRITTDENSFGNVERKCYLDIPVRHVKWNSSSVILDVGVGF